MIYARSILCHLGPYVLGTKGQSKIRERCRLPRLARRLDRIRRSFLTALLVRHPSLRSVIDHLSPRNPQLVCSARAWSAFLLVANTKWEQVETKDGVMGPAAMAFKAALERDFSTVTTVPGEKLKRLVCESFRDVAEMVTLCDSSLGAEALLNRL